VDADDEAISSALDAFWLLPAHPDARPALEACRDAGVQVIALTNGTRATTEHLLAQAELSPLVDAVVAVDQLGVWKPAAAVYRAALDVAALVSGNGRRRSSPSTVGTSAAHRTRACPPAGAPVWRGRCHPRSGQPAWKARIS
jgi:HAD superfamily hydrolase (TIGR01493 family)